MIVQKHNTHKQSNKQTNKTTSYHGDNSPHKLEEGQMLWVDAGCRVDLQGVTVLAGVLEQTVHGVQHLVGQVEEPLPCRPTVV